ALERELAGTATPYRVRTAGVPGYSTDQEYLLWRRLAGTVRPRRVLLLFHESDLADNLHASVTMGPARFYKPKFELRGGSLALTGVPAPPKDRIEPPGALEPVKRWFRPFASYALLQAGIRRAGQLGAADAGAGRDVVPPDADMMMSALLSSLKREVRGAGAD